MKTPTPRAPLSHVIARGFTPPTYPIATNSTTSRPRSVGPAGLEPERSRLRGPIWANASRAVLTTRQLAEQPVFVTAPLGQMVLNHCALAVFVLLRYAPVRLAPEKIAEVKFALLRAAPERFALEIVA